MGRLAASDDLELGKPVVAAKGSVWVLTFAADRLVHAEYFPPLRPVECDAAA